MPGALSYIHVQRRTPAPAVLLQGVLTMFFILAGDIVSLIEFASFLIWTFYGLAFVALIVLRKTKPDTFRPYKVPLVIPVLLAVLSVVLSAVPIILDPSPGHVGAVFFILLGVLVYHPLVYRRLRLPGLDKLNYLIQVVMEVAPPTNPQQT